ncbi:hypothetical protein PG2T_13560 [Immundisolibacter cernigliae]|uniref:Uncharacterized protein n=2 Tax=Immundisolibacter cernigliae TaxID=1810504 RepID=A0A1B1YWW2_9GAMM|nr:hypothetical protein PG2T_13560 [Immundisolibacter cernigliae]
MAGALAGTAAGAVRALLGVLGAPALGQALTLEKALAGRLQDLDRAPDAASFDPLARPPVGTAPVRPRTPSPDATGRRRPVRGEPAAIAARGIGALIGDALAGKGSSSSPAPIAGTLPGIAAALASLSESTPGKAQAARAIALNTTGAVSQAAGLGAQALAALSGTAGAAPVLAQIAALGNALWWQIALSPPSAGTATPTQPPAKGPARLGPGGTGTWTGTAAARASATAPATEADADVSTTDHARSALAGIGRLTVELFEYAARAGATSEASGQTPATPRQRPAPRAPSVLTPERGALPAPAGSAPAVAPTTSGASAAVTGFAVNAAPVSADDLARALRAEGALRGVGLP